MLGSNPVPASSGKTNRHRLNRGGDRQANAALWRIAFVRMRSDPDTRAYIDKRIKDGKSPPRSGATAPREWRRLGTWSSGIWTGGRYLHGWVPSRWSWLT